MKRREFIKVSAGAGLLVSAPMLYTCGRKEKKLNVLVLGGTFFVGPAIVESALQNGHDVTLFNRGITNPDLFPELRLIKGDRDNGIEAYEALKNEKWDVVIDVWPEQSKLVDEATRALKNHATHYIFISSIAVYNNFQEVGLNEESAVVSLDLDREEWSYPEEKLAAENFVRERFPAQHTILRPGPIKGWRDPAVDLLYWCVKLRRDPNIIAPGSGLDPLQFIDVRDVGRFAILAIENHLMGNFNCTGPRSEPLLWNEFLALAQSHFDSETKLIWANEQFLKDNKVYSFSDLPLWAPLSEDRGFMQISNQKMDATGFVHRPISSTLDDCLNWHQGTHPRDFIFGTDEINTGLNRKRELALIAKLN